MQLSNDFYKVLFDKGEYTCFTDTVKGIGIKNARTWGPKEKNEFFSINPMREGTTRAGKNVSAYRNILVEIDQDEDGNTISPEDQKKMFIKVGLPYATLVWSGGKSFHAIISIDGGFKSDQEYRNAVSAVYRVLAKNGVPNDEQVKDISRLSRAAGAVRMNTKQLQEVAEVRTRITRKQFDEWLAAHDERVEEPKPVVVTNYLSGANANVPDDYLFNKALEWSVEKNGEYSTSWSTGAHMWLFKFGVNLWKVDINLNSAIAIATQKWGATYQGTHGGGRMDKILKEGYEFGRSEGSQQYAISAPYQPKPVETELTPNVRIPDNLPSAKDVEQEVEEVADFVEEETHDINAAGISQYFRVATKYYKRIPDGTHILWDKQTINDDFGRGAIHAITEKYNDFVNIPNYIKDIRAVNGMYNLFRKPSHVPVSGEWPTIEKLLRKVFQGVGEDQYEIGLDYLQLLWTKPKQKLRILVVASKSREAGKDTFLEFVRAMFSPANSTIITAPDFELPYNSHYASKHVIMINEVKFNTMNKQIRDKIKNYATQEKVHINGKNDRITEIDYWGHLIMATNHINDFVEMDEEETRYWVREMPALTAGDKDPKFMDKVEAEIPHFIDFLLNRELYRKEKAGRFWHTDEECATAATQNVKKNSRSNLYEEIYELLEAEFCELAEGENVIYAKAKEIQKRLGDYKLKAVTMCLRDTFKFEDHKTMRQEHFSKKRMNTNMFEIPRSFFDGPEGNAPTLPWETGNGK